MPGKASNVGLCNFKKAGIIYPIPLRLEKKKRKRKKKFHSANLISSDRGSGNFQGLREVHQDFKKILRNVQEWQGNLSYKK